MDRAVFDRMAAIDATHWWFAGRRAIVTALLERRMAAGDLAIDDVPRAAAHFFSLLRGELHQQMVYGVCSHETCEEQREAHVASAVDMFLRAYGTLP